MLASQRTPAGQTFADLQTPCLLLDEARMTRNIERLGKRLKRLGPTLRPHLKTAKSIEVARRVMPTPAGPATVSTLKEAEQFAASGVRDILYAVGIAPNKLDRAFALHRSGVDLLLVVDNLEQARALGVRARTERNAPAVLIEIDCDRHRAGVRPDDPLLIEIARCLDEAGIELRGVMTHAGGSYDCGQASELVHAAEQERRATVQSATALREAGFLCPIISVGSTPTAHFAEDLTGVTEVRAGVFVFFDLVMLGLGVCSVDDIAISVLATVIGHQVDKNWILVDAGWMAMSRDRGTASQAVDQGYGLVCDASGRPIKDVILTQTNQEHGIVTVRPGSGAMLPTLPVGTQLRILPNHACATAAQHDHYVVLDESGNPSAMWPRFAGW